MKNASRNYIAPIKKLLLLAPILLIACASTGVVLMDKGTYMISKKSPQIGFGPPVGIKGEAYTEANEFCARNGSTVETIKYEATNAGFTRSAAVALEFKCMPK